MIRYENVHKVFGTVDVLKGISFEIPTGKVVCILGPSGSGRLRCSVAPTIWKRQRKASSP